MSGKVRTAVVGGSGFTGAELLRLAAGHPKLEVSYIAAGQNAGESVAAVFPHLRAAYGGVAFSAFDPASVSGYDLVFFALPQGSAMEMVPEVLPTVGRVVDLSADFRLRNASAYETWYGTTHTHPELLDQAVLGIPELFRDDMRSASLIAAAGCYVTAAALALAPLVRGGVVEPTGVIVDAASGISGAGRAPTATTHFTTVDGSIAAYGLLRHRHTPEIEQATGAQVLFTPHYAPMSRGIHATCYARPTNPITTAGVMEVLASFYGKDRFVQVADEPPATKTTLGSNTAVLSARADDRTGWVVVLCALDNLVKGAAGQAIQCANLALGLPEETGLPTLGVFP